jgi:hypothetical protein
MSRRHISVALMLSLGISAAGCSDGSQPTVPSDQPDEPSLRGSAQGVPDHPNDLARGVPGFGGFFMDPHGAPTIYLKDAGQKANVARALGAYFRSTGINPSQLKVLRGQFDWTELEQWQAEGGVEALGVPGAVFADADEASNRLKIGVEHRAAAAGVRSALARRGVPSSAVIIEETGPVENMATLQNASTRTGGLQINFDPDPNAAGSYVCTLGFNDGVGFFITNSHCTNVQGGTSSPTAYGQPLLNGVPIADEVADPTYRSSLSGCPANRVCRYSDAARAKYRTNLSTPFNRISRTAAPNQKRNQLEITGVFTIIGESASGGIQGQVVNKIGRTTGWTQGKITQTCAHTNVSGTTITQLCQTFVSAGVGGGDSGSPVFSGTGNVTLHGILWGGSNNGRSFVFSPMGNIERSDELGAVQSHPI